MSNSESAMNTYIMFGNFHRVMKKTSRKSGYAGNPGGRIYHVCVCVGGEGRRRGEGNEGVLSLFPYLI